MNVFRIAGLAAWAAACAFAQTRLDPVQWSMTSTAEVAKPGATIPLRLTARIEPGWHLYSLTIPKDLYPTKMTLTENPSVESYTVYQPPPVRAMDPNLQEVVETYSNQAEFWIPATLKKDAAGPVELTAQIRYRVCDDKQCLNPKTKTAAFKLTAASFAPAIEEFKVPAGYIEVKPGAAIECGSGAQSAVSGSGGAGCLPKPGGLRAHGIRIRPRRDLHAVRLPDDPHHGLVFPEPARGARAGAGVFARHRGAVLRAGIGRDRARRTGRDRAAGRKSLGKCVYCRSVRHLRAQPAGGV